MTLEEARKRTEASLARKRINAGLANGAASSSEGPQSPVTSGAMDSLLEKLRAAAPQARDQRDRRRRARLKERHQVRVASGQKMPDIDGPEGADGESSNAEANLADKPDSTTTDTGLLSPPNPESDGGTISRDSSQVSESEDVADRAASMLQGLRDNTDDGERARRRRESAEEERRKRRLRRRNGATGGSKDSADGAVLSPVVEPASPPATDPVDADSSTAASLPNEEDASSQAAPTPSIVVSTGDQQNLSRNDDDGPDTPPGRYSD